MIISLLAVLKEMIITVNTFPAEREFIAGKYKFVEIERSLKTKYEYSKLFDTIDSEQKFPRNVINFHLIQNYCKLLTPYNFQQGIGNNS